MAQSYGYLEVAGGKRLVVVTGHEASEDAIDEVKVPFTRLLGGAVMATDDGTAYIEADQFGTIEDRKVEITGTAKSLSYIMVGN